MPSTETWKYTKGGLNEDEHTLAFGDQPLWWWEVGYCGWPKLGEEGAVLKSGCVLSPFISGAGTTERQARLLGRKL